jgi:hypothetical protein
VWTHDGRGKSLRGRRPGRWGRLWLWALGLRCCWGAAPRATASWGRRPVAGGGGGRGAGSTRAAARRGAAGAAAAGGGAAAAAWL